MDKKLDVLIKINDRHEDEDGYAEQMEMTTVGTLSGNAEDYSIVYKEMHGELDGCITTLRVKNKNCITMTRTGSYNSQMIIEKDKRHNCHYMTPYGDFMMGIFAQDISSNVSERGGVLNFKYTVDFNMDFASKNELTITVKEKQDV